MVNCFFFLLINKLSKIMVKVVMSTMNFHILVKFWKERYETGLCSWNNSNFLFKKNLVKVMVLDKTVLRFMLRVRKMFLKPSKTTLSTYDASAGRTVHVFAKLSKSNWKTAVFFPFKTSPKTWLYDDFYYF
jgi:hypothetical protein